MEGVIARRTRQARKQAPAGFPLTDARHRLLVEDAFRSYPTEAEISWFCPCGRVLHVHPMSNHFLTHTTCQQHQSWRADGTTGHPGVPTYKRPVPLAKKPAGLDAALQSHPPTAKKRPIKEEGDAASTSRKRPCNDALSSNQRASGRSDSVPMMEPEVVASGHKAYPMDVKRESQVEAILLRPEADLIKSDVPNLCKAECDGVGPSSSASSSSNDAKPHELGVKPEPVDPIGVGAAPMSVDDEVRPEVIQGGPAKCALDTGNCALDTGNCGVWTAVWTGTHDCGEGHIQTIVDLRQGNETTFHQDADLEHNLPDPLNRHRGKCKGGLEERQLLCYMARQRLVRPYGAGLELPEQRKEWRALAVQYGASHVSALRMQRCVCDKVHHHTAASIDKYLKNVGLSPGDGGCPQPLQTFRVVQALRNPMHNAACHCTSIEQLRALIHESDRYKRMLVIAAAGQWWYWRDVFNKMAQGHPRLMFAVIDAALVNAAGPAVATELFAVPFIDGLHFVSALGSRQVRSFNGCSRTTQEIECALLNRYLASVNGGLLPNMEPDGMTTRLELCAGAAYHHMLSSMRVPPSDIDFSYRLVNADEHAKPDFVPIAVASLDASHQPHPALPRLLLPLRPDQLRSLQWMRQREADPRRLDGEELVTHGISTTPLQEWAVQWRLRGAFRLSGGVLADAIGHGKTAVALALVEAARQTALPVVPAGLGPGLLPSKATVIVVPPHLVSQWEGEIRKFLGHQLRLVTLMTYSDLDACTVQRLQHSDIVLISQRLFESNIYQASLGMKATVSTGRVYVDRSYLDAVESLRGRMSTKLLLERFYWHRVIYDEVHELLSDSADAPWALPLRTLVAQHRWGITGTPPVHEASDVHRLGLLLRLHLGTSQPVLNSFVAGHIRTNTLSESVLPAPEEHFIPVTLSVEETALYQQAKYERAELLAAWNLKAYEEILQICSHFSLGRSSTGVASAGNVVATILKGKRERKEQLDSKVQKLQQQLSRVNDRIKVITEDNTLSVQQFQSQLAAEKGKREELKDQLELSKKELSVISSSLEFFDRTVSELQTGAVLPECPVCLTQLEWGQAVITTCSHIYCVPCISEVIRRHKKCATCRSPLDHGQWTVVTKDNMKDVKWNMVTEVPEEYNLYGTKIGLVVQTLKDIHKNDPKAKCLVYCQWDSLKNKVLEAFRKFGIGCLTLEGGPIQLRTVIDKFEAPSNTDDFVLMCSLQKKAAGTNLQCANHVLFVHPFFARSDEQCMAWEAQAIGRVQRYGQTKQVHIHRFVALHTIEQELLIESRSGGWKKYFQRFSEKCSRQLQPPNVDTEP